MMEKRLYKSNENKMVDGVCGGIAEYFQIDPTSSTAGMAPVLCYGRQRLSGIYFCRHSHAPQTGILTDRRRETYE